LVLAKGKIRYFLLRGDFTSLLWSVHNTPLPILNGDFEKWRRRYATEYKLSRQMTTFSPSEVHKALLAKWNVETIQLDPVDKVKSVDEFLESLK